MDLTEHNLNAIRKVLAGDISFIWQVFTWSHSPQGTRHWERIANGDRTLTLEDHIFLQSLLDQHKEGQVTTDSSVYNFRGLAFDEEGKLVFKPLSHAYKISGNTYTKREPTESCNTCRYTFPIEHSWRDDISFNGSYIQEEYDPNVLTVTDEHGERIFGELNPQQKAFGFKKLEDVAEFVYRSMNNGEFGDFYCWRGREDLENIIHSTRVTADTRAAINSAVYFKPTFSAEGVEIYMNWNDLKRDRRTKIKVGRFLRMVLGKVPDAVIEQMTDNFNARFKKREFTVHRGSSKKDFAHAYTAEMADMLNPATDSARKSLANSCMHEIEIQGMSPAEIYASGDFEIIWLQDEKGYLGGRVVVYTGHPTKPQAGPVYGVCEHSLDMLEAEVKAMGAAHYDESSWTGAKLLVIPVYSDSCLMTYCDKGEWASLDDNGEVMYIDRGKSDVCIRETEGYTGLSNTVCVDCNDRVHEDDTYTSADEDCYCSYCYNRRFFFCAVSGDEAQMEDSVEALTSNTRYSWRASVDNPRYVTVDGSNVETSECEYTDEVWLVEDMEVDIDGNLVSPRYAMNNMVEVNGDYYTEEQLAKAGLDSEGNPLENNEEEEAA